ncbi:MAG: glycosyltransferase family 2 protein [Terriglobia bacterium]
MTAHGGETVAIIIPAYNEEDRIGTVLEAVTGSDLVDEVIVVNDGSRDATGSVVEKHGVRLVNRSANGGKGAAMQDGLQATNADIIGFVDADLVNFTADHLRSLIEPLLADRALLMTLGKFTRGRKRTDWAQRLVPSISGQRFLRREVLEGMPDLSNAGFGVETLISRHVKSIGARTTEVLLPRASQVMKEEKMGPIAGFLDRLRMYKEILKQLLFGSRST